jgi:hypothetical protein
VPVKLSVYRRTPPSAIKMLRGIGEPDRVRDIGVVAPKKFGLKLPTMLDKSEIIDRFQNALESATLYNDPYLLYSFSPFSEELYSRIIHSLPPDDAYMELKHGDARRPDGSYARLVLPLKEERIRQSFTGEARDFWLELIDILRDPRLRDLFMKAFEPELRKRFGTPLSEITALPVPMLMRDLPGYRISIHHDIDTKVITTQYYLPVDDSQKHLGTGIYRRNSDNKFELVRRMEFVPGAAYGFAVSGYSWHAVDPMSVREAPRNSLMLIYFRIPGIDY